MKHCASSKTVHTTSCHVTCHTFVEQHTSTWHMHTFLSSDDLPQLPLTSFPARLNTAQIHKK